MFNWIGNSIFQFFQELGLQGQFLNGISSLATACVLFVAGFVIYYIIRIILQTTVKISNKRFPSKWKRALLAQRFFIQLSILLPALIIMNLVPEFFEKDSASHRFFAIAANLYIVVNIMLIICAFLRALSDVLLQIESTKDKPIRSYIQIVQIIFWAIAIILMVSILIGKSPTVFLAGLGAFSAVLMLIFQDTIVGFVNSLQISANDLLRNGDWITVSKFNVDGTVEEINLISVKVRNFDNTISTVPVRQLVADSFQNWRGMEEQGIRRMKRSFFIDYTSIKPSSPELLQKFENRHETNLGCFREYIINYLRNREDVSSENMIMARLLLPSEFGVPLEIYCFAKTIQWTEFEAIQAEILEHILNKLPEFELVAYQRK